MGKVIRLLVVLCAAVVLLPACSATRPEPVTLRVLASSELADLAPVLADLRTVATSAAAGSTVELTLTTPAHARYLLIWFTKLPPDNTGTYQASLYAISVRGLR